MRLYLIIRAIRSVSMAHAHRGVKYRVWSRWA